MFTALAASGLLALIIAALAALVTQPFVAPDHSHPPEVSAERLQAHVKHLSVDLYPRSFEQFSNIERAAQYIRQEFIAAGAQVSEQEVVADESRYTNVIAHFGPPAGPLLVIGAHYDSHGDVAEGAKYPLGYSTETHTPGADDNASGVAGLIELARLLHAHPPSRPVELVAYTLEEPPHFATDAMGSVWHARSLLVAKREVRLMLSLEMIGYFSDAPHSQQGTLGLGALSPDRGNFIGVVGGFDNFCATRRAKSLMAGATDLPVRSINAPAFVPGIDFSDHRSYAALGFPALMVTDTAFYRNRNYHGAGDTYEKLDYLRMAKVVQGVYAIAQRY